MSDLLQIVLKIFIIAEFSVGIVVTIYKVVIPVLTYVIEFIKSYNEFRKWRKKYGK